VVAVELLAVEEANNSMPLRRLRDPIFQVSSRRLSQLSSRAPSWIQASTAA
jgi:hypothetical protein